MARLLSSRNKSAPKYRLHKASGQAVVTLNGKVHYLGEFNSDQSKEKYRRLISNAWVNNETSPKVAAIDTDHPTITSLAVTYAKHAKGYYQKNGKPTSEWDVTRAVLKRLRALYGSMQVDEFGPLRFQEFRQILIDENLARTSINHYTWHILKMFQLAVKNERIDVSMLTRLESVGNLLESRSKARETNDILPVDQSIVDATLKELTPTVAAMVRLQQLTGMRPGEVVSMRPVDIDRSGDIWIYKPATHKNEHKKNRKAKVRLIPLGTQSQEILIPRLLRDSLAPCFSPIDAYKIL